MNKQSCSLCGKCPPEIKEITGMPPKGCEHPKNAYCAFFLQEAELSAVKFNMKKRNQPNKTNE